MADVKITYGNLKEISNSYSGDLRGSALGNLEKLSEICSLVDEELEEIYGLAAHNAKNKLDDIKDSIRGLETSYENISKKIDKYLDRMEGKLEAKSEDGIIYVSDGIGDFKSDIKNAQDDCKDALKSNVWNINRLVLKDENRNIKDLANMSIDNYNEYASTCKRNIDERFDTVIGEIKILKNWNESDYHEGVQTVKKIAFFAGTVAISSTGVGAAILLVGMSAQAGVKMYNHGYSFGQSFSGAVVTGAVDYCTGKAGEALGSKVSSIAANAMKNKSSAITNLANQMSNDLLDGKMNTEWAENMLKNNTFVEYIEAKADGVEVSRYIKGDGFEALQYKYKYEFDNNVTFDRISSDEVLQNYIEEANLNNSNIDFKNKEILDNALENSKKYDKLVEFFEREKVTSWTELRDIQDVFIDQAATQGVTSIEDLTIEGDDGLKDFLQQTFDQATLA